MNNSRNSRNSRNYIRNAKAINSRYNNYYTSTSEAFKYAPDYESDFNPTIKKRTIKKIKEKYVNVEQKEKYLTLRFFVTLAIFLTIAVCIISISAKTIQKRFEIDELNTQLKAIKEDNKNLETEIAKNLDLEYIEEYAMLNLKMKKPSPHQIVHISVQKESYAVKNESPSIDDGCFFKKFNLFKIFNK